MLIWVTNASRTMASSLVNPENLKESKKAYIFWCLGLVGICGLQRFYTKHYVSGTIYLCTLGLYGIGQFIDLFFVGKMVDEYNAKLGLRAVAGYQVPPVVQQQVVVNIGEQIASILPSVIGSADQGKDARPVVQEVQSPERKIMARCSEEEVSIGQLCLASGLGAEEAKKVIHNLEAHGMLESRIDESGTMRYRLG